MEAEMLGFWSRMTPASLFLVMQGGRSARAALLILHHIILNLKDSNPVSFVLDSMISEVFSNLSDALILLFLLQENCLLSLQQLGTLCYKVN